MKTEADQIEPSPAASKGLEKVIKALTTARHQQKVMASWFGAASAFAALLGVGFLTWQAGVAFSNLQTSIKEGASDTAVAAEAAFLVLRGTGLAAIVGGLVYFVANLSRSALDQATRYDKRLIASQLIDYALHEPDVDSHKLEAAHKIVEVWGSTVESAYTPPRVAKRVGSTKVNVSKDGASFESDSHQP